MNSEGIVNRVYFENGCLYYKHFPFTITIPTPLFSWVVVTRILKCG